MKPLRVMQVVLSLAPGGTERLVMELARRSRHECVPAVCCLDEAGAWAPELAAEGVPVEVLGRRPGFHPGLGARLGAAARAFGADVLHCHQYSAFVYGRIAAALSPARIVFTEHGRLGDDRPSPKRRIVNPVLARLGGRIFAVSHDLRAHMAAEGFPASRIGVIHNGIDAGAAPSPLDRGPARAALGLPPEAFVVGTAARLDPVKGFDTLLAAFAVVRAARDDARLVILGDGPQRGRLEAARASLGLESSVVFAGHRADVRWLLAAFDVFANSSVSEGISLTILEGMAAALPVVATRVGGTPEVVEAGATGLLVPPRDPGAMAGALLQLASDAALRERMGRAGRERMLAGFTIDRMVAGYVEQYRRAAGRRA